MVIFLVRMGPLLFLVCIGILVPINNAQDKYNGHGFDERSPLLQQKPAQADDNPMGGQYIFNANRNYLNGFNSDVYCPPGGSGAGVSNTQFPSEYHPPIRSTTTTSSSSSSSPSQLPQFSSTSSQINPSLSQILPADLNPGLSPISAAGGGSSTNINPGLSPISRAGGSTPNINAGLSPITRAGSSPDINPELSPITPAASSMAPVSVPNRQQPHDFDYYRDLNPNDPRTSPSSQTIGPLGNLYRPNQPYHDVDPDMLQYPKQPIRSSSIPYSTPFTQNYNSQRTGFPSLQHSPDMGFNNNGGGGGGGFGGFGGSNQFPMGRMKQQQPYMGYDPLGTDQPDMYPYQASSNQFGSPGFNMHNPDISRYSMPGRGGPQGKQYC